MSPLARMLIILLLSPFIILFVHAVMVRMIRGLSPQVAAIKAIIISYIPTSLLSWYLSLQDIPGPAVVPILYSSVVYLSFAYTYFHFFNTSETARRIRILYEIYRCRFLRLSDITAFYKTVDIISLRLDRLQAMNQLKRVDGHYMVSGRTLYSAALLISWWRRLLGFDKSAE